MSDHRYEHIARKCFVNAPFAILEKDLLDFFIENRLQPEIGLDGNVLYEYKRAQFEKVSNALQQAGLKCTLHAPFHGISLGDGDQDKRRRSYEKLRLAFDLIPVFQPLSIVCHLNFKEEKNGWRREEWYKLSRTLWKEFLLKAEKYKTPIMLENTYEKDTSLHQRLLEDLNSPYARFCFDVGHVSAFACNSWEDWLPELEPWLGQLHLHDNNGKDDHLAVGAGSFDFLSFFTYLLKKNLHPIVTLEPHHKDGLWESLAFLDNTEYSTLFKQITKDTPHAGDTKS